MTIDDVSHVVFRAPDLNRMAAFLEDFGMSSTLVDGRLYARGRGSSPYLHITEPGEPGFVALGFRAGSTDDVVALARREGIEPEQLQRPGGGIGITLKDPDGVSIEVVAGQQALEPLPLPEDGGWNNARERKRLRRFKRNGDAPAHVVRLGHCVFGVSDFQRSEAWYKERFGFITSDQVEDAEAKPLGAFLRCDRGDEPTDHHTLALMQGFGEIGFNHAAFEVVDVDDLLTGHMRLMSGGWQPFWGVGRHLLGSQLFDYWRDPWGHTLEHWTDGDLLTREDGSRKATIADLLATQWGPPPPMPH